MLKKLLLALLLISPFSFADWGDVYYCQMTTYLETTLEGKSTDYKLERVQFKLDESRNAMVFGSKGFFANTVWELVAGQSAPSKEFWYADFIYSRAFFTSGKFVVAMVGNHGITSISADCDKF
jgi:hypothetical protein